MLERIKLLLNDKAARPIEIATVMKANYYPIIRQKHIPIISILKKQGAVTIGVSVVSTYQYFSFKKWNSNKAARHRKCYLKWNIFWSQQETNRQESEYSAGKNSYLCRWSGSSCTRRRRSKICAEEDICSKNELEINVS